MLLQVLILVLSIIALYYGAEFALEAAEKIGKYFGLSPLVIGLLIVGFGTSLPEFFVSQLATYRGQGNIALGNIVGSNIANVFLILGVAGLLTSLAMTGKELRRQLYVHLWITVVLCYGLFKQTLNIYISVLFILSFVYFLYVNFQSMKKEKSDDQEQREQISFKDGLFLFIGFFLLYLGGEFLVSSGSKIGAFLGISTYVISAIFVAFGTSFPELVTTVLACKRKKETDLIVGNIIGSNIFNVAFVLGSLIAYDIEIDRLFTYEVLVLMMVAVLFIGLSFMKKNISKPLGFLFLMTYLGLVGSWIL